MAHKTSRLVHYRDSLVVDKRPNGVDTLSCGRVVSDNYVEVVHFDTVSICRRCKVNAMKDGVIPAV